MPQANARTSLKQTLFKIYTILVTMNLLLSNLHDNCYHISTRNHGAFTTPLYAGFEDIHKIIYISSTAAASGIAMLNFADYLVHIGTHG